LLPLRLPNRAADPQGASEKVRLKIMALGAYAPYVIERFTKLEGSELSLYYVLSTWNPYVVVLMKSRVGLERCERAGVRIDVRAHCFPAEYLDRLDRKGGTQFTMPILT